MRIEVKGINTLAVTQVAKTNKGFNYCITFFNNNMEVIKRIQDVVTTSGNLTEEEFYNKNIKGIEKYNIDNIEQNFKYQIDGTLLTTNNKELKELMYERTPFNYGGEWNASMIKENVLRIELNTWHCKQVINWDIINHCKADLRLKKYR